MIYIYNYKYIYLYITYSPCLLERLYATYAHLLTRNQNPTVRIEDLFVHRDALLQQFQDVELTAGTVVEFDVERDHHKKSAPVFFVSGL